MENDTKTTDCQVQRAFKRLKLSTADDVEASNAELRPSTCNAMASDRTSNGVQITPMNNIFTLKPSTTRLRRNSCPERIESQAEAGDQQVSALCTTRNCPELASHVSFNHAAIITNQCAIKRPLLRADPELPNNLDDETTRPDELSRTRAQKRTTCSDEARRDPTDVDMSVDELAGYFDEQVHIPRKMSFMAELMYT